MTGDVARNQFLPPPQPGPDELLPADALSQGSPQKVLRKATRAARKSASGQDGAGRASNLLNGGR